MAASVEVPHSTHYHADLQAVACLVQILDHTTPRASGRKFNEAKELFALARAEERLWLAPIVARVALVYEIENLFAWQALPGDCWRLTAQQQILHTLGAGTRRGRVRELAHGRTGAFRFGDWALRSRCTKASGEWSCAVRSGAAAVHGLRLHSRGLAHVRPRKTDELSMPS